MSMLDPEVDVLNRLFHKAAKEPEFRNRLLNHPEVLLQEFKISERITTIVVDTIRSIATYSL